MTPDRLRIVQVAQKPQRRGAELFAIQLAAALRKLGHEASTLFLYQHQGPTLELGPFDLQLGAGEDAWIEKAGSVNPLLLKRLMGRLAALRPHIVQLNGARSLKYGAYARLLSRRPTSVNVYRNIDDPRYWQRDALRRAFYRRFVIPRMDGIIAVSDRTLEGVNSLYRPRARAIVIRNGVDPGHALAGIGEPPPTGSRWRSTRGVLLYVGALTTQKRPDRFVRIVAGVHRVIGDIEAWMVGEGPLDPIIREQIDSQNLQSVVRLCGSQPQLGPYFSQADLLLVTSDSDGIPAVVLEAGLARLPTVATQVGGLRECVLPDVTGVLVPPEDEAAFVDAVLELLVTNEDRKRMGERARSFCEDEFGIGKVARRYETFYLELLGRRSERIDARPRAG